MLNIALSGASGKMGQSILAVAEADPDVNIICKLTRNNKELLKPIDIFIDFSTPSACQEYLIICQKLKIPMVIGTTGLSTRQYQEIIKASEIIPILYAPNMSIGVNICYMLLENLSNKWSYYFPQSQTVDILEVHHKHKKDAPSGTALKMAEIIAQYNLKVNFTSKRIGEIKGKHQVVFNNPFETIIIKHQVKDRNVFAKGAVLAAKWLINKSEKLYSFSDLLSSCAR